LQIKEKIYAWVWRFKCRFIEALAACKDFVLAPEAEQLSCIILWARQYFRKPQGGPMAMMEEFKKFAMKGNVVDLAVGVIIGGAFGRIVDSLVQDVIMPPIGKLFGGLDFASYYLPLNGPGLRPAAGGSQEGRRRAGLR
jgi:hypothetical protein